MERVQNFKHCNWISDEVCFEDVYSEHMNALRSSFDVHPSKAGWKQACESYFMRHVPINREGGDMERMSAIEQISDPSQIEDDINIDLLTVPNELPSTEHLDTTTEVEPKINTSWFGGTFNDNVIPEEGSEKLLTLYNQDIELNRRYSIGDYATLRHRSLKYFSTVRLPQKLVSMPFAGDFSDDIIVNVRIQRPFFKKTHFKKQSNKFPNHSQELLLQGSQPLSSLRDAIVCVNDSACYENMASNPDLKAVESLPTAKDIFPSGLFYINGTFYRDMRQPHAKDYSERLLKWAKRQPDLGEFRVADMSSACISDLQLRLGYPYLYLHQGDCEHLLTFTDVRLAEATDPTESNVYPIARGHSSKLTVKCCTCSINLAAWVVVGYIKLNTPRAHMCHPCLKKFCYGESNNPLGTFKLYRYHDEVSVYLKKEPVDSTPHGYNGGPHGIKVEILESLDSSGRQMPVRPSSSRPSLAASEDHRVYECISVFEGVEEELPAEEVDDPAALDNEAETSVVEGEEAALLNQGSSQSS